MIIIPIPSRRFDPDLLEMMDRPGIDEKLLQEDLRNLRMINRFFGGYAAIRKAVKPLFQCFPKDRQITIFDLATGSADLPIVMSKLAKKLGRSVTITAVDKNPVMLQVARELSKDCGEIKIVEGDILDLQCSDKSFDIVVCSLALHHFSRENAVRILRNMQRLARVALVVHDLCRSWTGAWIAWLYTHLTTRNPLTLHDSYLSVLRSFTLKELTAMAREAGITNFTLTKHPFFRMVMVAKLK
ncbi:MAG TPA: methyltransferase domain-containing protein [Bacteroidota bacterium]|nr:methyltransferase domain-containing protein [Bacteroidota bacterium]